MSESNPYEAPKARVDDVVAHDAPTELATRWQRFAASIVDGVCFVPVFGGFALIGRPLVAGWRPALVILLGVGAFAGLIALIAINLVLLHRHGQTIGKRLRKIRILRMNGERATLARLVFLRGLPQWLVGGLNEFLPGLNLLSLVDVLFIFGEQRRCVHDYIANTKVVQV